MCGIAGYIGHKQAYPILINMLHHLEYRGYDSAGVALINEQNNINIYKSKGKVSELENYAKDKDTSGIVGIAHTRWATHGEPNQTNAHPHFSESESLAIVHNGIIENYNSIKQLLIKKGYTFRSDTDTEALVQLIEFIKKTNATSLKKSIQLALNQVVGAYAIAIINKDDPDEIFVARCGSPLVVGVGQGEFFISSGSTPLVEYTDDVIYLKDNEIATISIKNGVEITTLSDVSITPEIKKLEISLTQLEKGDFPYFMLKEIYEQPHSIASTLQGRVNLEKNNIALSGIIDNRDRFLTAKRIIITACGSSWHAGLIAKYAIEEIAKIPVEVEYSSEFRYRNPVINEGEIVIAISQSGETADTIAAIQVAKNRGAFIFSICNEVGSSISRMADSGCYTHVGPEIGVAATKTFTAQVSTLILLALCIGHERGTIDEKRYLAIIKELSNLPQKIERILTQSDYIADIAKVFTYAQNCIYLGRGYNYPIALEGALKLKEISYIHAEGYPAAEMKHGPIALISPDMPVVVIAPKCSTYDKIVNNVHEIRTRKGHIVSIVSEGDTEIKNLSRYSITIPDIIECLSPVLTVIPLQLLAYHIAVNKDINVDQPRNLAKSVTVE